MSSLGGFMLVLTGPSATGKTETAKFLMDNYHIAKVVTCTTRPPREGESADVDYHFLTADDFQKGVAEGKFLETAEYNGHLYGTQKEDVGPNKVACIEDIGVHSYREYLKDKMFCVYLNASEDMRLNRMLNIRKDSLPNAEERIEKDRSVYADDGARTKELVDLVLETDHMTIKQQATIVYQAYVEWQKAHHE